MIGAETPDIFKLLQMFLNGRSFWLEVFDSSSIILYGFYSTSALKTSLSKVVNFPDQNQLERLKLPDRNLENHMHLRTSIAFG